MPTPSLRILIVDPQHSRRLNIEKMLNQQGYYRIAPMASFEDLLALAVHAIEPFDLLVVNSALVTDTAFNLDDFCRNCPSIRNVLMYEGEPVASQMMDDALGSKVIQKLSSTPDIESIKNLMGLVDPPRKDVVRWPFLHRFF
ncbi:hypothetical protein [Pseudomonas chlororaphis]|uniref:hypothetical protein n=1 Tax=Pseudomonas chlororaphis TaxID=587753 RepID=UPI000F569759|nr:hypothetical protein [Pseudomonas chlororaphis]AZC50511.1 hypothetical protein C4K35_2928 [Pseudomonas chlororaphis subsp. piscium]AZC57088.1 hypothetical protein C4K34_2923 [Pseudomonas chlororaphis subsp. piscium]AZC75720.1 hypothetical protein C4K31_2817 [Pseudomonas chlororaphis subsp. piscium]MBP5057083.1 hypothetical protein [Pseudomonas chlororaphis]MBP5143553.1 hypothetical protein [Pseudomonas chlororaphis]